MALIKFKDLPDETTPANSENINHNFEELEANINKYKQEDYSLDGSIVKCGYKINNKDVYLKRMSIKGFPNASEKVYYTGLRGCTAVKYDGYIDDGDNIITSPYCSPYNMASNIEIRLKKDATQVNVTTGSDRTSLSGFIDIYFVYN